MPDPQANQGVHVDFDVPATMRDGITLRANIYRPAAEGAYPVLLTRLPYGKDFPLGSSVLDPVKAARQGYITVVQDTRGRFTSEGDWYPLRDEGPDSYDSIEWAATLPGSNGKVGTYGASYFGFTQWVGAIQSPPHLAAMVPYITWANPHDGVFSRGGALELGIQASWLLETGLDTVLRRERGNPDPRVGYAKMVALAQEIDRLPAEGYQSLPLKAFEPFRRTNLGESFFDGIEHPFAPEYSAPSTILGHHGKVNVPCYNAGGWYDIFLAGTLRNFQEMRAHGATPEARQARLLIGPWSHTNASNTVGDTAFGYGASAALINLQIDFMSLQLRWFDRWLKGIENGVDREPPVKIFVMGENVWRDEQEWPLARALPTPFYLHSGGHANTLEGDGSLTTELPSDESADRFEYDPLNPVPTLGGSLLMPAVYRSGAINQQPIERRDDMLVYTSAPLEHDLEVTGPITVTLWAASSAPDTDFVARLVDVHPDGFARNLTDGIIRARYRHGLQTPELLEPGKAYEYTIDLWATSNLFKAGHRIRLDITSSNFPRWDRNLNTGHEIGADAEVQSATQTILHSREYPSHVLLPVVPR
ncbi:MAG TPA: CocE/NonD family hydrolase [Ktedonobacterales bacterium]|nr:CocE/NonD family hydrolase [Ktedonobacterales bacterium]